MTTKRKAIRKKVYDDLKNNLEGSGINIYKSRVFPTDESLYPIISIYSLTELNEPSQDRANNLKTLTLTLLCFDTGQDAQELENPSEGDIADKIDDLCSAVENVFDKKRVTLGGLCHEMLLKNTEIFINLKDQIYGRGIMTYEITYRTVVKS